MPNPRNPLNSHSPKKTPFEVFRTREPAERPLRLTPPPASVAPPSDESASTLRRRRTMRLHLTPVVMISAALALTVVLAVAYEIGRSHARTLQTKTDQRSTQKLADLHSQPVNGLLLRTGAPRPRK